MSGFLELSDLKTHFAMYRGVVLRRAAGAVKAVDGISLQLRKGEILGLVGESGCGKSTLARTVMQLVPATGGEVILEGRNLAGLKSETVRRERANFQMIFQDPYASLNPRMTVFDTLAEALQTRKRLPRKVLAAKVSGLMRTVGLPAGRVAALPPRVLGRSTAANRDRTGLGAGTETHSRGRTRFGSGCFHSEPDHQSASAALPGTTTDDDLYLSRYFCREIHFRSDRSYVSRPASRNWPGFGRCGASFAPLHTSIGECGADSGPFPGKGAPPSNSLR